MAFITKEEPLEADLTMLAKADSVRGPVDEEHDPDQVAARHRSPLARVARLRPVVAHEEVLPLGYRAPVVVEVRGVGESCRRLDVRLVELLPVDVDVAAAVLVDPV